jgi:hypothetical protein
MHSARTHHSLPSAIADQGTGRVRGSLLIEWLPGMAHRTTSFPSNRGSKR